MEIKELSVCNFKSFIGEHSICFSNLPVGLHFITGINKAEPSLSSNASGKTSLLDAIHFAIYGKTLRGLRASNVRNWTVNDQCTARLKADVCGTILELTRTIKPNSLKLNDKPVQQEDIDATVDLSQEEFQHAIVIGQFNNMFFDLKPADKLALFSDILQLDYWLECSRGASNQVKELSSEFNKLEQSEARLHGKAEQLKNQIDNYRQQQEQFADQQRDKIQQLNKLLSDLEHSSKKYEEQDKTLKSRKTDLSKKLDSLHTEQEEEQDRYKKYKESLTEVSYECRNISDKIDNIYSELAKFKKVHNVCPYCKQTVRKEHLDYEISKLEDKITSLKKTKEKLNKKYENLKENTEQSDEIVKEIKLEIEENQKELKAIMDESTNFHTKANNIQYKIQQVKQQVEEVENEDNPYDQLIEDANNSLKETKKSIKKQEREIDEKRKIIESTEYWVKGFKNIRLFLIEEALNMLEIEVNNNLIQLGLYDWEIKFDVEKENKSGTVSKGFQVLINSPHNNEPVPWESWSGGEAQRLRLAGMLGLSDLILNRKGMYYAPLFLDEPTRHLSQQGIDDLLDVLYNKAVNENRQIFLIDHHSLDYGGFSSVITVEKTENGSIIL